MTTVHTTLDHNDVSTALWYARNSLDFKIPYARFGGTQYYMRQGESVTEEQWEALQWNPPPLFTRRTDPDPDADPKPSWSDLVTWCRLAKIDATAGDSLGQLRYTAGPTRQKITDEAKLDLGGRSIHVGDGLDHMTGLLQMAEQATSAGATLPHIVMRDGDQRTRSIHRQSEIREILDATARRENVVESAHNAVLARYHALERITDDEAASLDEREAAADKMLALAQSYEAELKKEMAAYDPDVLPADLPTLKEAYIERLEATATGHQRELKGALTQQGIDNWAACDDSDDALKKIAEHCREGVLSITAAADDVWKKTSGAWARVTDMKLLPETEEHEGAAAPAASLGKDGEHYRQLTGTAKAKAAFTAAKAKVEAVVPLNVPLWTIDGAAYTPGTAPKVKARQVLLKASNPTGVTGAVAIRPDAGTEPAGALVIVNGADLLVRLLPGQALKKVVITATADNLCGPALVKVELAAP